MKELITSNSQISPNCAYESTYRYSSTNYITIYDYTYIIYIYVYVYMYDYDNMMMDNIYK